MGKLFGFCLSLALVIIFIMSCVPNSPLRPIIDIIIIVGATIEAARAWDKYKQTNNIVYKQWSLGNTLLVLATFLFMLREVLDKQMVSLVALIVIFAAFILLLIAAKQMDNSGFGQPKKKNGKMPKYYPGYIVLILGGLIVWGMWCLFSASGVTR